MRTMRGVLGLSLLIACSAGARADMITGSASGGAGAFLSGSQSLGTATGSSFGTGVVDLAYGSFALYFKTLATFPDTTLVTESPILFGSGASTFTAKFGSEGTFTAVSQVLDTQATNAVNLTLLGSFTPSGDFAQAGYTTTEVKFTLAFTQVHPGAAVGSTFSMAPAVPVPPSILLALTSIVSCGALGRFRPRPR